jgi:hypothetical protein
MERASHALAVDGGSSSSIPWTIPRSTRGSARSASPPAWCSCSTATTATRLARRPVYGVPLHRLPDRIVPGTPLQVVDVVDVPVWRERALWWPQQRLLLVPESVGSAAYYRAPGERVAAHPMRRLLAPRGLAAFEPEHLLFGPRRRLHAGAAEALRQAVTVAPRTTPAWVAARLRGLRNR